MIYKKIRIEKVLILPLILYPLWSGLSIIGNYNLSIINPACAGRTQNNTNSPLVRWDHPRLRG